VTPESGIESNIKEQFDNSFNVPLSPAEAWPVLSDIERIAACIPGVKLAKIVDPKTYEGTMSVGLGAATFDFTSIVHVENMDPDRYTARLKAHGSADSRLGVADVVASFRLIPRSGGSTVLVHSDLGLSGVAARYGSSVSLVQATAAQIMTRFAANLHAEFATEAQRNLTATA
jgi:carbon monoxide dehydrogenase subunit G